MKKKRILVCGTGFGKIYINTIAASEEYELIGILGKGSARTLEMAKMFNVPLYIDVFDPNIQADCACVIIPNASGGGNGSRIASDLLKRGIPTLLEHPAHEKEILMCLQNAKDVPFMVNPFYRYTAPIKQFLEVATIISRKSKMINASMNCAIHVLYDALDILGCALNDITTWDLGEVSGFSSDCVSGSGNKVISAFIGNIPVTITVNTEVDKVDPDHALHLYHRVELTYSTGRLCLVNTNGPVVWMPFLNIPRDTSNSIELKECGTIQNIPSSIVIGNGIAPNMYETFVDIWPNAIICAINELYEQDKAKKIHMAQFQIYISRLWSEICKKIGYYKTITYEPTDDVNDIYLDIKNYMEQ